MQLSRLELRRLRGEEADEVPHYYEAVSMRPEVLAAGWVLAILAVGGGIAAMVIGSDSWLENLGAIAGTLGAVLVVALVRLRRFEILLGEKWLAVKTGPVRHRFPVRSLGRPAARRASSWRRLFSPVELEVKISDPDRTIGLPTRDPEALAAELEQPMKTREAS